ncbi:MAG: ATPase, T2SS/T4P/T4SS family [Smithella sp.]|jgi:type II secretory ATPase GspE/PulE/Tfp pilus assembly ATPase PilB-like protein
MKKNIFLHFKDGRRLEAGLTRSFSSKENELKVAMADNEAPHTFLFDELSAVFFLDGPCPANIAPSDHNLEEVLTLDNTKYLVHAEIKGNSPNGFYAVPAAEGTPWRYAFFISSGIKMRSQKKRIGNILSDAGVVSKEDVGEAFNIQQKLRNLKVGEIIAETANVKQESIEKTILDKTSEGKIPPHVRIGDILISAGLVTLEQVNHALEIQKNNKGKKIGDILIEHGLITEEQLLDALATKFRLRMVDLKQVTPSRETLSILSKDIINRFKVFPIESSVKHLVVATSTPTDLTITDRLRFITNRNIEIVVATAAQIAEAIDKFYNIKDASPVEGLIGKMGKELAAVVEDEPEESVNVEADSTMITFINQVLIDAYTKGASDIHFEPGMGKEPFTIRYRVDGECYIAHKIPSIHKAAIISRLKILSELDIAERRRPQSGKIMLRYEGRKIEYRIEVTPTVGNQEDAVLRILAASKPLPLDAMGFSGTNLARFKEIITKPYGIILCVGPTGSGKTTTLHSALGHINKPIRKIWTAEDPVEITQPGLRQVQIHPKIGFNFADALRSFLRADPDVIMIGEMRDEETAKIAIEASLTGHLVLSTLHTNSAPETAVRLIEMGMDPFNFSDALLGIMAQRLARSLCDNCKKTYHPGREEYDELVRSYGREWFTAHKMPDYLPELSLMRKNGCEKCSGTGYKGRIAFHELLVGTKKVKDYIKKSTGVEQLRDLAIEEGMRTLRMDGIMKVFQGITDYEQVNKVCM